MSIVGNNAGLIVGRAVGPGSGSDLIPIAMGVHDYSITNPGAESGDYTTGWTLNAGGWGRQNVSNTGTYGWWGGASSSSGSVYQDITAVAGDITRSMIDNGNILFVGGYAGNSWEGRDQGGIVFEFRDGTPGSVISRLDTGYRSPAGYTQLGSTYVWVPTHLYGVMPTDTVTIRIVMKGVRRNGTANNCHMDDIFMKGYYQP